MLLCTLCALSSLHFRGTLLGVSCEVAADDEGATVLLQGFPLGTVRGKATLARGRLAHVDHGLSAALKRRGCRVVDVDATRAFERDARVVVVVELPLLGRRKLELVRVEE